MWSIYSKKRKQISYLEDGGESILVQNFDTYKIIKNLAQNKYGGEK